MLEFGANMLQSHGISNYKKECEWILLNVIDKKLTWLLTHLNSVPTQKEINYFIDHIEKRKDHIPLQLIMGKGTFYGRDFSIFPGVFIPRQSSDVIIDTLKKKISQLSLRLAQGRAVYQLA